MGNGLTEAGYGPILGKYRPCHAFESLKKTGLRGRLSAKKILLALCPIARRKKERNNSRTLTGYHNSSALLIHSTFRIPSRLFLVCISHSLCTPNKGLIDSEAGLLTIGNQLLDLLNS